ncbi:iron hydrogenase [Sistotremastrum suecicum HHB10207 ss-3]|uniref:Cytosolic Fe-S cluster assembly factor NAR1 n=1 Tax=Sistotremastrum suecicum HHB10207 ss-3 TaxID=1314776 RepID=A0A166GAT2_9AGAM|nr:iron hydrogenase [Sistotremastrum suecicum HHB10207 ss-3]
MAFSGALTITDLNDFISPSQACIKPVEVKDAPPPDPGAAATTIHVDTLGGYYEIGDVSAKTPAKKLETAQISLNDCLACSGCITSAESVLITLQSHSEVLSFLSSNPPPSSADHKVPVFSIAPQSLASLTASLSSSSSSQVSPALTLSRIRAFCDQVLGVPHVFDTTFARHISLLEHTREFEERKALRDAGGPDANLQLPMLASACPGWVCYAEKTHGEMLPFISKTKSPQQVMGTLVKQWLGKRLGKTPDQIYHVTVMPCYDKKLEASRQDFYNDIYSTRDVDCVITTGELEILMKEKDWDLSRPLPAEYNPPNGAYLPELLSHQGSSSGSYLQSLISTMAAKCENPTILDSRFIRSSDYEEFTLKDAGTGRIIFKGAKCYGFRNLQNLVRKVAKDAGVEVSRGAAGRLALGVGRRRAGKAKEGESDRGYDYVEVMACPGGCTNGGGQLRPMKSIGIQEPVPNGVEGDKNVADSRWGDKAWLEKVESLYWHDLPTPPPSPPPGGKHDAVATSQHVDRLEEANQLANRILKDLCLPASDSDVGWNANLDGDAETKRNELFRTAYRRVESDVVGLAVKW